MFFLRLAAFKTDFRLLLPLSGASKSKKIDAAYNSLFSSPGLFHCLSDRRYRNKPTSKFVDQGALLHIIF